MEDDRNTEKLIEQLFYFEEQHTAYKEQLAEALVAFNRLENLVSELIAAILSRRKCDHLISKVLRKSLSARAEALELLLTSDPEAPPFPHARLNALGETRHQFAHGHFTTNPNTGEFVVSGKGKSVPWEPAAAEAFLRECDEVRTEIARVFAFVLFGSAAAPLPPGASKTPR